MTQEAKARRFHDIDSETVRKAVSKETKKAKSREEREEREREREREREKEGGTVYLLRKRKFAVLGRLVGFVRCHR